MVWGNLEKATHDMYEVDKELTVQQRKVYGEFFKVIKLLNRKLDETQISNKTLVSRIERLETGAPLSPDASIPPYMVEPKTPTPVIAASFVSMVVAVAALTVSLTHEPTFSKAQFAALNVGSTSAQIASLDLEKETSYTQSTNFVSSGVPSKRVERLRLASNESLEARQNARSYYAPAIDPILEALENSDIVSEEPVSFASVDTFDDLSIEDLNAIAPAAGGYVAEDAVLEEPEPILLEADIKEANIAPIVTDAAVVTKTVKTEAAPKARVSVENTSEVLVKSVSDAEKRRIYISADSRLEGQLKALETKAFTGHAESQHDLATFYAAGQVGGAVDYKRARQWFTEAAAADVANAYYNLGVMSQQGLGGKKDLSGAIVSYKKAAELGHPEALYNLGIAYTEGIGVSQDVKRGVSYFERAADAGVNQAAYNLGVLYESNFLGGVDKDKAVSWYKKAADTGHVQGAEAYARLSGLEGVAAPQARVTGTPVDTWDASSVTGIEPAAGGTLSNSYILDVQTYLVNTNQLPSDGITGTLDYRTKDAIRAYQKKSGLDVTGFVSEELFLHMQNQ